MSTAVVAHSQPWFASAQQQSLARVGIQMLVTTDDGAQALGTGVAEQPTVLVCGDRLKKMTDCSLLAERVGLPRDGPAHLVDNGASQIAPQACPAVVVLRPEPPADVVAFLALLLTKPPLLPPGALAAHESEDPQ